jgi:molybdenum cofactor cytidylyltransferase
MGRNKMLLPIEGESLVRRAARRALSAGIDPLIVVVGHEADMVRGALAGLPCVFAYNPSFRAPTSGSLHRGLEQLPPDVGGAVILLADMVNVTSAMIRALHVAAVAASAALVVSRYGGEILAPPHLFSRSLFPELLAWSGGGAGRGVAQRHLSEAVVLDWPPDALVDVDTPEDLNGLGRDGVAR